MNYENITNQDLLSAARTVFEPTPLETELAHRLNRAVMLVSVMSAQIKEYSDNHYICEKAGGAGVSFHIDDVDKWVQSGRDALLSDEQLRSHPE